MSHSNVLYRLTIAAEPDDVFLCRVCGVLASLSLIPESFLSRREGAEMALIIVLSRTSAREADLLQRKLVQMPQVTGVECAPCRSPRP